MTVLVSSHAHAVSRLHSSFYILDASLPDCLFHVLGSMSCRSVHFKHNYCVRITPRRVNGDVEKQLTLPQLANFKTGGNRDLNKKRFQEIKGEISLGSQS